MGKAQEQSFYCFDETLLTGKHEIMKYMKKAEEVLG
jgi:hypothetical protein